MKFRKMKASFAVGAMLLTAGVGQLFAQGDDSRALIDMLVKKGLLTNQEAADVAVKIREDVAKDSGYRIKVGSWVKELQLFGDARLRYEYREGQTGFAPGSAGGPVAGSQGDTLSRERYRYRLRFGALAKFTDDFSAGLRLETSTNNRSTNVTFGDDAGPFGKASDGINIGQIYLNWAPADWVTLTGGKMPNPLMTTSMVWDPDLNPEGAAEKFKYAVNDHVEVFATLGQFLYDNVNPSNPLGNTSPNRSDPFMFANQVGATYKFSKDVSLTLAPVAYVYTGSGQHFATVAVPNFTGSDVAGSSTALDKLLVVEIPLEFKWRMLNQPWKIFGDFAVNANGKDRAHLAGDYVNDNNVYAYQVGAGVGSAAKKGGWEAKAFWQHTDLYALDPNLVDSDIFDSRLNMEGFVLSATYAFTDFLSGSITYARADRANKNLYTVTAGDVSGVNPLNDYQLLQLDLNWKF